MYPSFTESTTHPRKASRNDKRGPRMVLDVSEDVVPLEATAVVPVPTCTGRVSSLAAIYKEAGYQGYLDYVNADTCPCSNCAKQVKINTEWMITNAGILEESEAVYVDAMERKQERREQYDWSYRNRHH